MECPEVLTVLGREGIMVPDPWLVRSFRLDSYLGGSVTLRLVTLAIWFVIVAESLIQFLILMVEGMGWMT